MPGVRGNGKSVQGKPTGGYQDETTSIYQAAGLGVASSGRRGAGDCATMPEINGA